jgi:hypothetical protein
VDNIRMDLGEVGWGDVYWIGLVQDRNRWRALVDSVLNVRFHKMLENYQVASQVVASPIVLSSIELVRHKEKRNISSNKMYEPASQTDKQNYHYVKVSLQSRGFKN